MGIDLADIVRQRGGALYAAGRAAAIPGPGHSRRDRSLSLRLSEDGGRVLFHSFAGDPPGEVMAYLGVSAAEGAPGRSASRSASRAAREARARAARLRAAEARAIARRDAALCQAIWNGAGPVEATPAETYLWRRGLMLEGAPDVAFHPAAPTSKAASSGAGAVTGAEQAPATQGAMVCLVRAADGTARALHLTYLTETGDKAFGPRSRLMFGPVAGGAVRLEPMAADGSLAIAEGVETAASYAVLTGRPAWAVLSTSGMRGFAPPPGLRRLWIAADDDANGAGLAAATALAERLRHRCDVEIALPPGEARERGAKERGAKDWNDVLIQGGRA